MLKKILVPGDDWWLFLSPYRLRLVAWVAIWSSLLGPRTARARTAAIDSTVLWASGGVVPRSSIDTASYWTKSGRHG